MKVDFRNITKCRICYSKELKGILNLGKQPAANSLKRRKFEKEKLFPLNLVVCNKCKTSQLSCTVNPNSLFQNYVWVTGTSKSTLDYLKYFFKKTKKYLNTGKNNILEIASNDGSLLSIYKKNGHRILGVDPAKNICSIANKNKIKTVCGFFSSEMTNRNNIVSKFNPDIIIARNVIPHVENIHSVIKGIANLSSISTKVLIEFHYSKKIVDELQYDSIYHEHVFYFTIISLTNLFKIYGLFPFDLFTSPISGGSLVISFSRQKIKASNIFSRYLSLEKKNRLNNISTWKNFGKSSIKHSLSFIKLIKKSEKNNIIGFGSSARSSTFLNFTKLNHKKINIIFDNNPFKSNKYTAGTNIKIISPISYSFSKNKKYTFIILAWNFKSEIITYIKKLNIKCKIIIPFPNIKEINL